MVVLITGCAASTGILPAGPDTYTVTERFSAVRGGATEAQRVAMTESNDFCEHAGKKFFPLNMKQEASLTGGTAQTGYTVLFRCLLPDDPELKRPNFEQAPNIVIEKRQR